MPILTITTITVLPHIATGMDTITPITAVVLIILIGILRPIQITIITTDTIATDTAINLE
ncbi:MAG: hypothetical protein A3F30_01540 [Candidatus Levybacteria bacterium RIFCSPHIGHO2_12_FULL_37_12]|nr:MAG: hypothetical protein A3C97_00225 [Candidatus Levybacteria bacterium RIFCSPHIGHO2_02_FULL_37_11]OGH29855.1 MAG: hypothetical protein A3F30_01540 [Candidatus Levybacteria bacterium RIFCSPHIGHO2_12_FULL_37_12]